MLFYSDLTLALPYLSVCLLLATATDEVWFLFDGRYLPQADISLILVSSTNPPCMISPNT